MAASGLKTNKVPGLSRRGKGEIEMVMTVDQIVQLVAAGGGISINAHGKTLDQLVRIAAAASHRQARIVIANTGFFTCDQLVSIASAGKGCVFFDADV